ncbi:MAG: squalene/phytoene synthase family protein [Alphaproteobacteria bacterium]|nr:squalene/phytoene synthase family protein [Alphaproteobacteria bacterium]
MAAQSDKEKVDFDLYRSGKDAGSESFPVASLVLTPRVRPHVLAYYGFVRTADDIADHDGLPTDEKLRLLNLLDEALDYQDSDIPVARKLAQSARRTGVGLEHAREMLKAFRRDAREEPVENWDGLWNYCQSSAAPAGRFLLDIHGESKENYPAADGLCAVLQITNHVQDVKKDWLALDRCYIPMDWRKELDIENEDLIADGMTDGLRAALHRMLDRCKPLYEMGLPMLPTLKDRSLRAQVHGVAFAARRLAEHLYARDPLAARVDLSTGDKASMAAASLFRRTPSPWPR